MPLVALPWGSMSMMRTECPRTATDAPRLTAVVDLPTPPFWLTMANVHAVASMSSCVARSVQQQQRPPAWGPARRQAWPHAVVDEFPPIPAKSCPGEHRDPGSAAESSVVTYSVVRILIYVQVYIL